MGGESSWQEPTEKICRPEELMRHTQVSWGQADQQLARSIDYDKVCFKLDRPRGLPAASASNAAV
ncbi:hypothetical protein PC129_g1842 [Phytophthora cactorum]|nr:hypothetical protein PC129_g1842 [Phytophthora cactorum]